MLFNWNKKNDVIFNIEISSHTVVKIDFILNREASSHTFVAEALGMHRQYNPYSAVDVY